MPMIKCPKCAATLQVNTTGETVIKCPQCAVSFKVRLKDSEQPQSAAAPGPVAATPAQAPAAAQPA
ncbi:MAG: hypothetical protein AAFP69_10030, partial [Planctomycetota bacterium]